MVVCWSTGMCCCQCLLPAVFASFLSWHSIEQHHIKCVTCGCRDMQTSVEDIWAAGDVCTVRPSETQPHWFQMRLWTQVLCSPYDL